MNLPPTHTIAPTPFVVSIVMLDGNPGGVKTIEKSNWSGSGLEIPRPLYASAAGREELQRPGVYLLIGPPEENDRPLVYIGEGDPVGPRLAQHIKQKDFWTSAIIFTSTANRLNKAHVRWLESNLIAMASDAKRCSLMNLNASQTPSLSEGDAAEAEGFLSNVLQLLGVLEHRYFEKPPPSSDDSRGFFLNVKGVKASGYESSTGFVVRAGSMASATEAPSIHKYLTTLRESMLAEGLLESKGGHLAVTQDYEFSSPSTAAGVLLGRTANGRLDWKTQAGVTLKEIQTAESQEFD